MYSIVNIENDEVLGYTREPKYIRKNQNETLVFSLPEEAEGIIYNDIVYNLAGNSLNMDYITIQLIEIDEDFLLNKINQLIKNL